MPRTGWGLMGIKNPETIAEHTFRMAIAAWLLGEKKNLNIKRVIKTALSHDLCEVYAGDVTPFFYWDNLNREKKHEEKILLRGVRISQKEKEKRGKIKFEKEKKSLLKLIKFLKPGPKKEIFSSWFDFEKRISKEGKFVKQVDRIETLLQAIEYFGTKEDVGGTSWWEGTEEIVDDPLLLELLKTIQKKFYTKKKQKSELGNILDFLLEVGKLKKLPRKGWVLRGVKNPETMANHIFTLSLMAWLFGEENIPKLNIEKLLKMTLCHQLPAIYAGDRSSYDKILKNKSEKEKREILKRWIRFSKKEKAKSFLEEYKKEKAALKKLTLRLEPALKAEIIQLWEEYKTASTPEGRFLNQLRVLTVLLQALQYRQEDKTFSIDTFWEWALEISDGPMNFEFMEELKKKFHLIL